MSNRNTVRITDNSSHVNLAALPTSEKYVPQRLLTLIQLETIAGLFLSYDYSGVMNWLYTHDDIVKNQDEFGEAIEFMNTCRDYFMACGDKRPVAIAGELMDMIRAWKKPTLSRGQKSHLAATLACSTLAQANDKIAQILRHGIITNEEHRLATAFLKAADRHFKRRDGFTPQAVIDMINDPNC